MNDIRHDLLTAIEMMHGEWIDRQELAKVCGFMDGHLPETYDAALRRLLGTRQIDARSVNHKRQYRYLEPQTQPERIRSHIHHFEG
jgi:hypothetical protein